MKKEWLGVAIMAVTIAGCSQNEVTDVNNTPDKKNEISFDFSTEKRAVDATVSTMQTDADGFMVFATQNLSGSEELINNQKYNYDQGQWKWKDLTGDAIPKWPVAERYPVNFYAYYPNSLLVASPLTKDGLSKEIKVETIDKQIDILAALQKNIVVKPANSRITFTFDHILSKIAFKAEVLANARAYIQAISVNQVKDTRSFDFSTAAWTGDATSATSYVFRKSPATGSTQVEIAGGVSTAIKGDNTNAAMMLMPQATSDGWNPVASTDPAAISKCIAELATKANIQMIYRMDSGNGDMVGYASATTYPEWDKTQYAIDHPTYKRGLYIKVAYSLGVANWAKGKSYTYEFKLGTPKASGGYLINPTFYDENGNDTGVKVRYPGQGGGEIEPGNPPFETSGDIDFDIIVNEWDTTHGDANKPLN